MMNLRSLLSYENVMWSIFYRMLRQSLRIFATCEYFEIEENLAASIVGRRYEKFYTYDSFEILAPAAYNNGINLSAEKYKH
jgi:hypothetical protein